jgi:hypothetical protein
MPLIKRSSWGDPQAGGRTGIRLKRQRNSAIKPARIEFHVESSAVAIFLR